MVRPFQDLVGIRHFGSVGCNPASAPRGGYENALLNIEAFRLMRGEIGMKQSFRLLMILLACTAVFAQRFDGTLRGTVTDVSGAVIADAKVSAKNNGTGALNTTVTSNAGVYTIPNLLVGSYTVTNEANGLHVYQRGSVN